MQRQEWHIYVALMAEQLALDRRVNGFIEKISAIRLRSNTDARFDELISGPCHHVRVR